MGAIEHAQWAEGEEPTWGALLKGWGLSLLRDVARDVIEDAATEIAADDVYLCRWLVAEARYRAEWLRDNPNTIVTPDENVFPWEA